MPEITLVNLAVTDDGVGCSTPEGIVPEIIEIAAEVRRYLFSFHRAIHFAI